MPLVFLPDIQFPVSSRQADSLMVDMVQLNLMEAGLTEKQQRGLTLYMHTFDLWVKSGGRIDYRGQEGHARMMADAMAFAGHGMGSRVGDLPAAHLSLDWHDCCMRLKSVNQPMLSADVSTLLNECRDLVQYSLDEDRRCGLLMDYLGKRKLL